MILDIVQYGHPVLRKKCQPVTEINAEIQKLAGDMLETMTDANGVGLAAPQVGIDIRLAVIDVSHDPECVSYLRVDGKDCELASIMPIVFINPEMELGKDFDYQMEGCLSMDGIRAEVRRPVDAKVTLTRLDGSIITIETDGLLARAFQHEIDHLNGILFTDRLNSAVKVSFKNRLKRIALENGFD